ncbi:SDR family oxidoreductase, partial [Streptomyces sp. LHD-70]|uniref:SDR family NAD(P)-dependent oxidoreductase n=1 Tax=Streptomyces sp. LHD-70 TaxID=3072140 RepID=UPI00281011AE
MNYLEQHFGLGGRTALVTGGSSGIGRAIAHALAGAGARVVLMARREEQLKEVADEINSAGLQASWVSADLGDRDTLRAAADRAAEAYGEPDILVTSAGVNLRPPLDELSEQDWDTTMAVNLDAPFLLGQRFGPTMAERGWGPSPRSLRISPRRLVRCIGVRPDRPRTGRTWVIRACGEVPCQAS